MRRAEFLKRLDERPDDPSASAGFDAQMHTELDATRAILVTESAAARLQATNPGAVLDGPRLVQISGVAHRFFAAN